MTPALPRFHADIASLRYLANHDPASGDALHRARWLLRYYRSGAHLDVEGWNSDAVYQRFGLTTRKLDTCFEMGDSAQVLEVFMDDVLADPGLSDALRRSIGETSFAHWSKYAGRQFSLL